MANGSRRNRRYRDPDRKETVKIKYMGYPLEDLFTDDEVADLIAIARRRVAGEFFHASEKDRHGRKIRTDNYIIGIGGRLSNLARYVVMETHRPIVRKEVLPADIRSLSPRHIDRIIVKANYDVTLMALQLMRNHEVWYDEALGIWQICQSSVDDFLEERKTARRKPSVKQDDRSFHGRVRSQSKRRGAPPGVSVSHA